MIVRQVKADNLFRFAQLALTDLPAQGVIGISGPNEAGKSAIVELICLALFGRTFALSAERLGKAVKWGATQGSVEVVFTPRDGQTYSVARYLEADGRQRARLSLAVAGTPLARGVAAVNHAIGEMLGYGYQEYVDALYHAQRGAEQPGAHQATIKALAGVAPLERVAAMLQEEARLEQDGLVGNLLATEEKRAVRLALAVQPELLGRLEGELHAFQEQATAARQELAQWHAFREGLEGATGQVEQAARQLELRTIDTTVEGWRIAWERLGEALKRLAAVGAQSGVDLEAEPGEGVRRWQSGLGERLSHLNEVLDKVSQHRAFLLQWLEGESQAEQTTLAHERATLQQARQVLQRRRGGQKLVGGVFLLLALPLAAAWGGLTQWPEHALSGLLNELLRLHLPEVEAPLWPPLLAGLGGVFGVVALLFLLRAGRFAQGLEQVRKREAQVEARAASDREMVAVMGRGAGLALPELVAQLGRLEGTPWSSELAAWRDEGGRKLLDTAELAGLLKQLADKRTSLRREVDEILADADLAMREDREQLQRAETEMARLQGEIRVEEARRAEDGRLAQRLQELAAEEAAHRARIRVREVGRELLLGAARPLSNRFNQELRRFLSDLAPRLTEGRYHQVRIGPDLTVEAYSAEKEDFVEMDEISTGAQQQLMLAVRLALAQALAARTGQKRQVLVLDEAFAYYDRQRMFKALAEIRANSPSLAQIWVAAQAFEADHPFDLAIGCLGGGEGEVLLVRGG